MQRLKVNNCYWFVFILLGLAGTLMILFATTKNGIGVSPDTTLYFSEANKIVGLVRSGGNVGSLKILEPPLFPAVLAAIKLITGAEPYVAARYLNSILFGLVVFLSVILFKRYFASTPAFILVGTLSVLLSYSLVSVYLIALTEPLFILFVLAYIIFLNAFLIKQSRTSSILLSLSAMLAFLTRYVGAILIFVGVVCILLFTADNWKTKIKHSLFFSLIAGLPTSIWALKDFGGFTDIVSYKGSPPISLMQNIGNAMDNFLSWFLPYRVIHNNLFLIALFLAIFLSFVLIIRQFRKQGKSAKKQTMTNYGPLVILVVPYFAFLLLLIRFVIDIENRYLAPIFIPITLLILAFVRALMKLLKDRFDSKLVTIVTVVFFIGWIVIPANKALHVIEAHYTEGWGYSSITWQNSETVRYIVNNYQQCTYYSNRNDAIKYLTGLDTRLIPEKHSYMENQKTLDQIWPPEGKTCLVIFNNVDRYYLYSEEELLEVSDVTEAIQYDDGSIYVISNR